MCCWFVIKLKQLQITQTQAVFLMALHHGTEAKFGKVAKVPIWLQCYKMKRQSKTPGSINNYAGFVTWCSSRVNAGLGTSQVPVVRGHAYEQGNRLWHNTSTLHRVNAPLLILPSVGVFYFCFNTFSSWSIVTWGQCQCLFLFWLHNKRHPSFVSQSGLNFFRKSCVRWRSK